MKRLLPRLMNALLIGLLLFSCTKINDPVPVDEHDDVTVEKDVTGEAVMTVNLENNDGPDGAEGSAKLIDNDTLTKFLVRDIGDDGLIVEFQFEEPTQVASYKITSGNDADPRDPMDWQISGSDDGEEWVPLDKQDYEMFSDRNLTKRYSFKNTRKFTHYRWHITKLYAGQMFQASEFRLLSVPSVEQVISPFTKIDTITREGLTLFFVNKASDFNETIKDEMVEVFFTNYPRLLNDFNPDAQKEVAFRIEPSFDGVAYVFSGFATYGAAYMTNNPNDLDVVTHEVMHLVQSYAGGAPGWLTEGIADYVRHVYGLYNDRANWSLPDYQPGQHYTDAYRITARFLVWVEQSYDSDLVKTLDDLLRRGQYEESIWLQRTGNTLEDLWTSYEADSQID
ncbi:hypothetical protein H8S90_15420 [Olivibacter sp. SDN3]|uniref:basic secretory protein-like protein n=1 Tax=Olivibacter sp. SDN3 TaxID=2764720 RepID=UPI001650EE46|nr:basic secretory protein-like protein [Olivibacter sp. SDN3]QNL48186.1 hypothetical protein H8S90_15420 [Olivibacter sp. SDN3]